MKCAKVDNLHSFSVELCQCNFCATISSMTSGIEQRRKERKEHRTRQQMSLDANRAERNFVYLWSDASQDRRTEFSALLGTSQGITCGILHARQLGNS